jgi:hypothetical protein
MAGEQQLSRGGAVAMGIVFIAAGVMPILIGLGVVHPDGNTTPVWVAFAAGLLFVCAGLAIVVDYAIAGGVGPDGDLVAGTPFAIRVANFVLGLAIIGLMTAVFGWVAFGSGPRQFSTTIVLPFWYSHGESSELSGRIAFGLATILMVMMFVACGIIGVRRLAQAGRQPLGAGRLSTGPDAE